MDNEGSKLEGSNGSSLIKMPLKFNIKTKKDVIVGKPSSKFNLENDVHDEEEERGIKRAIVSLENGLIKGYFNFKKYNIWLKLKIDN